MLALRHRLSCVTLACVVVALLLLQPASFAPVRANVLNATCLEALIPELSSCYDGADNSKDRGSANPFIRTNIVSLIFQCSGFGQSNHSNVLQVLVPDTYYSRLIHQAVTAITVTAAAGLAANFTYIPLAAWPSAPDLDVVAGLARGDGSFGHHGWLLTPQIAGTLYDLGALQDLSGVVQADTNMDWADIHPFYRASAANFGGEVVMLPIGSSLLVMYARRDVLAAHSLAVPATWEDLIAVAAALNGTDMNGDGVGDPAICFPPYLVSYFITAVWASVVQTHGLQQGLYYDALTMAVMANTTSFAYALDLMQRMQPYTLPLPVYTATLFTNASFYQPRFSDGGCAFTFATNSQFKRNSFDGSCRADKQEGVETCDGISEPRYARGRVVTAPLPGSTLVYNRNTDVLENCTPATCPYASMITAANGLQALVNLAPYSSSTAGAINALAPTAFIFYAYSLLSFLSYPSVSTTSVLNPLTDVGPVRLTQLDEGLMQATYNTTWVSAGYKASDVASMLATLNDALSHPNIVLRCRLPNSVAYSSALTRAAFAVTSGHQTVEAAMAGLSAALQTILPATAAGLHALQLQYWTSLNIAFAPPPSAPASPPHPPRLSGTAALLAHHTAAAVTVLVLSGVAIFGLCGAAVWLLCFRRRWSHRTLWGRVLAPTAGPLTTLLVTDIESSTMLWETFDDAQVMDTALRLHHTIIRRLLIEHSGYETATEGDSFIVAFHCPGEALQFAVDVQVQLLAAPWPEELDGAPAARSLWSALPGEAVLGEGGSGFSHLESSSMQGDEGPAGSNGVFSLVTSHFTGAHSLSGHKAASWGLSGGRNVRGALALHFPVSEECGTRRGGKAAPLVHRGLRVRIGMHSGVASEADVNSNSASGRTTYSGEPLVLAKAVADAAHGGQILFSETSHSALCTKSSERSSKRKLPFMSWHSGLHTVKEDLPPLHLYMATSRCLIPRAALFPPLRSIAQRLPGVLDAPLGVLAIASLTLPGASALLAWDWEEATHAISIFQAACAAVAEEYEGFVTEARVGEMVGAFPSSSAAVAWCLHVVDALKKHAWSDALLSHPLCEDLCIMDQQLESAPSVSTPAVRHSPTSRRRRGSSLLRLAGKPSLPPSHASFTPPLTGAAAAAAASTVRAQHSGFGAVFDFATSGQQSARRTSALLSLLSLQAAADSDTGTSTATPATTRAPSAAGGGRDAAAGVARGLSQSQGLLTPGLSQDYSGCSEWTDLGALALASAVRRGQDKAPLGRSRSSIQPGPVSEPTSPMLRPDARPCGSKSAVLEKVLPDTPSSPPPNMVALRAYFASAPVPPPAAAARSPRGGGGEHQPPGVVGGGPCPPSPSAGQLSF